MTQAAKKAAASKPKATDKDDVANRLEIQLMKWDAPDYGGIIKARMANLARIRERPEEIEGLKAYYADNHQADFINDWGWTYDPRNADIGLPTTVPFILFDKQREWVEWVIRQWRNRSPGLCEKSRDMGVSWLAMSLGCTLCITHDGIAIGVGSRKTEYVDKIGSYKPLLPKARIFMENLPVEFRAGYEPWRDSPFMRITFPETKSIIGGEGGDDIGRGDRTSVYFVDEYAHFERPELTEASLSQTTNCRIDMSSVRGMNNPFARKRWEGKVDVFIFDWHDDPRKNDEWYAKQCADLDPVVVAQEIDRDYSASVSGIVIPGPWVRSAIGALEKLGLVATGARTMSLDVADEGVDMNAAAGGQGINVDFLDQWSGKGSDIFATTERAFAICDEHDYESFRYDADGLGADVRGDARVINERRALIKQKAIAVIPYRGSAGVHDPEGQAFPKSGNDKLGRTNQDYYQNRKAQAWWGLRRRFQLTHRWVTEGKACSPDEIISLDPKMKLLQKLIAELSQVTYTQSTIGKMQINKTPPGMRSPNLADAVVGKFAPMDTGSLKVSQSVLAQVLAASRAPRRR